MQLNDMLARQIVSRAMKILSFSVNVMDEHGLIIASGNPERIHQRHEGAVLALTENRVVEISEATALQLKGVRPGINLPISYQGELIGVIGISGDPEEVRAYAELVRMTAELILEQAALTEQLQWDKRHKEELVLQLIRGEGRVDQLQQAARFLGLDLAQPRVVAVLALEEADPARLRELVHQLENPERDNLVAINGLDEIVVLKPAQVSEGGLAIGAGAQPDQAVAGAYSPLQGAYRGGRLLRRDRRAGALLPDGARYPAPRHAAGAAQTGLLL